MGNARMRSGPIRNLLILSYYRGSVGFSIGTGAISVREYFGSRPCISDFPDPKLLRKVGSQYDSTGL